MTNVVYACALTDCRQEAKFQGLSFSVAYLLWHICFSCVSSILNHLLFPRVFCIAMTPCFLKYFIAKLVTGCNRIICFVCDS